MQFNIYSLGFAVGAVFIAYVIRLAYRNARMKPYIEFKILLWLFLYGNLCMLIAMSSTDQTIAFFFHEMKFIAITIIPPLMYAFCYNLNGINRRRYKHIFLLMCIIPSITLIGIATNPLHHLFCVSNANDLVGNQVYLTVVRGPLFMLHAIYSFGLSALTVVVQLIALRKLPRGHRVTSYFLLTGLGVNVAVTIYGAYGGAEYGDPGVMIAPLFATLMYIGMILKPNIVLNAANRITVENVKSCALFFDLDKTLLSANEAARGFFDLTTKNYGTLTETGFFTGKLGIEYTEQYTGPELNLREHYFQIDDHHLTDDTGIVCGRAFILTDVTNLRNTVNDMEYALNHDALTGILNHDALLRYIEDGLEPPASFIVCGIRGMKIINNLFGYEYGDDVIKTAVRHLRETCGGNGICARFAGDVFVAVMRQTGEAQAKEIISDIEAKLSADQSLSVPIRMWFGSQTLKRQGELPEQALTSAFDELGHAKLMLIYDDFSLEILQHAQTRAGISAPEKCGIVTEGCLAAGRAMGLSENELAKLDMLTRVYDIGLVSTPKELLSRKGHFTNDEWQDYKLHVERGYRIACLSPAALPVSAELLAHHEMYDGRGYPNHLRGDDIPLLARILSAGIFLADLIYDEGILYAEALNKLKSFSGTRFDPAVVDAFAQSRYI